MTTSNRRIVSKLRLARVGCQIQNVATLRFRFTAIEIAFMFSAYEDPLESRLGTHARNDLPEIVVFVRPGNDPDYTVDVLQVFEEQLPHAAMLDLIRDTYN